MRKALLALAVAVAAPALAQTRIQSFSATDRPLLARLIAAEDARGRTAADLATLREGLSSASAAVRRFAARSVGRLERADLIADLAPLLSDGNGGVRGAAADAVAQAATRDTSGDARRLL